MERQPAMRLTSRFDLSATEQTEIERAVGAPQTLEDVVRWGLSSDPLRMVEDVVVQDEFTHDVVMTFSPGRFLVWDVT